INTNDIATSFSDQVEVAGCPRREVNNRRSLFESFNNLSRIRKHKLPIVIRAQTTHPAVKELYSLGPRFHLTIQIARQGECDQGHHGMPSARITIHEGLCMTIVLGRTTLRNIRGQSERSSGKPN